METQEKSFDKIMTERGMTWRLEQDLNGLIFMQKNKKKEEIEWEKSYLIHTQSHCLLF